MTPTTLEVNTHSFLAQRGIAAAGASRNYSGHLGANLIYHRRGESVRPARFRAGIAMNRRWK